MMKEKDELYMRRCLQLAECGRENAKPNPMVGAVIVYGDRIIGEGYHVRCGEGHAEVNAFASVSPEDEPLLSESTIYVSLEPCSHYGKTPPCCDLIISKGVRRVVVGCVDPFAKVQGRGIERIRNAGIEVTVGVLEAECRRLNRRFITYHEHHRPYITLKWAQSLDGFIDSDFRPYTFSTPFTKMLSHSLRAENDAILVGRITDERDCPSLNIREWWGKKDPLRIVIGGGKINIGKETIPVNPSDMLSRLMDILHERGVQSLIVEGGARTLQRFINARLYDEIRIETAPVCVHRGTVSPVISDDITTIDISSYSGNTIATYIPTSEVHH